MPSVLGIDAAWTATEPSGVSLLAADGTGGWRCAAVAPSYGSFLALATGTPVDWEMRPTPGRSDPTKLLAAARTLGAAPVAVVAADIPLATVPIRGRREADQAVSRAFGARGASAHSPSARRPGPLADSFRACFAASGYPLATVTGGGQLRPALIEVYPHVSLLALTGAAYRIPYKVQRSALYHPGSAVRERIRRVHSELASILNRLREHIQGIDLPLPPASEVASLRMLKRYEDALDGLICAWSALCYLRGDADALGDETAAIWVPRRSRAHGSMGVVP